MTSTVTDPPERSPEGTEYRQCSTCGFATPAHRTRCHYCWNRLDEDAPVLAADVAADLIARQEVFLAERQQAQRRRQRRRQIIIGAIAIIVLAWVGWWVYRSFIYTPPPVPEASNPALSLPVGPDVWATSNGDPHGARSIDVPVPLEGTEAWSVALERIPVAPLVADTERVYVVAEDYLAAVSIEDGSVVWEFPLTGAPFAAPTVAEGRLYVSLRAGQLLALNAATGEELWYSLNTGARFGTSPIVVDGYAYVFGIGAVVAFDAETGEELWSSPNRTGFAFGNPAVTEDHIAGVTNDEVLLFSRETGAQTYFHEFPGAFPLSTVAHDGAVYASSTAFTVAFEETSGRPWWEYWRAAWNQFWVWGIAPNVPDPERLWRNFDPPAAELFPGAIAGDLLVLVSEDGEVQAVRLADGTEAWRHPEVGNLAGAGGAISTADGIMVPFAERVVLYDPATGDEIDARPVEGERLHDAIVTSAGLFLLQADGTLSLVR